MNKFKNIEKDKNELEDNINKLLNQFSEKYNICIDNVKFIKYYLDSGYGEYYKILINLNLIK